LGGMKIWAVTLKGRTDSRGGGKKNPTGSTDLIHLATREQAQKEKKQRHDMNTGPKGCPVLEG